MRGDGSEKMKDFASLPEDGDYTDLFESFIDSFSPSGNIFNTKAKAKQIAKEQRRLKNLKDERMEMDFESQFRGGNIHGFNRGTSTRDYQNTNKIEPKQKPDLRFSRIRQMDDREAMARMMMAEDDKNFQGGQAVGHVIFNRSQNPNYVNMIRNIIKILALLLVCYLVKDNFLHTVIKQQDFC